ncbi:MAG: GPR endopeptidase [Clostridiales bacterium]|jgi:spore protease|nr:GPR endopeptidase [Clostridiales bacterium]
MKPITDLAVEAAEILNENAERKAESGETGVGVDVRENDGIKITWIEIENDVGSAKMGKPIGSYVTIESDALKDNNRDKHEEIAAILARQIAKIAKLSGGDTVLIVGLGNWSVTPDALGPKVIKKALVTRHIMDTVPEELAGRVRPVAAITPGVMGITGIETADTIKGVADAIDPAVVICVDALAARNTSRLNSTIQISDTGLAPGSGMGNYRAELTEKSLGRKVLAVGVPTVIDAATLVSDSLDLTVSSMRAEMPEGADFFETLENLERREKSAIISRLLEPYLGSMFVAPKDADAVVERLSNIIANALNIALHPGVTVDDVNKYVY